MEVASLSDVLFPQLHHYTFARCKAFHYCSHRQVLPCCRFKSHEHTVSLQTQYCTSTNLISEHGATENKLFDPTIEKSLKELALKGYYEDVVLLYVDILNSGLRVEEMRSFPLLVKAVGALSDLQLSRQIHGQLFKLGAIRDTYVANSLLSTLWKCGAKDDAVWMFKTMHEKDSVSWSTMISGFCQSRLYDRSLEWFRHMVWLGGVYPNRVACLSALSSCASVKSILHGQEIHAFAIKSGLDLDAFLLNGLLEMYMKCGHVGLAERLFQSIVDIENSVLWNVMILGYVNNGYFLKAILCFTKMMRSGIEPDSSTMIAILPLCSELSNLALGKQIHALIVKIGVEMDVRVRTSLINMYFNCANYEYGLQLFDMCHHRNLIMWGLVISNCARMGYSRKALHLFVSAFEHGSVDSMTLLAVLRACSSLALKPEGMVIHGITIKLDFNHDTYIGSALVDMYAKCQDMASAQTAFSQTPIKDDVLWSSLISGYDQSECWDDAVRAFHEMLSQKIKPNAVSIACILSTCARVYSNLQCMEIHNYIIRHGFGSNILVSNSLISAYAKCGNMKSSQKVFLQMANKDNVSWNSLMLGLGQHGHVNEMFVLFEKMKKTGFKPDHQTFTAILSACSHTGRVTEGLKYFRIMKEEHKLEPKLEQYTCLVDLLGRAGYLDQAYDLIMGMPFALDDRIWGSLLGSCKIYGEERLAEIAASRIFDLNPASIGYHVLLANFYEDLGKRNEVIELRLKVNDMGLRKSPGCSWIDVNNQIHVFTASDRSHHQVKDVYAILDSLTMEMKSFGYSSQL